MSSIIESVFGRRVFDSRGRPTVEAEVKLKNGVTGRAIAPSGASTGRGEACELRDGGSALAGKDVTKAIANINAEISAALNGKEVFDQESVDARLVSLDGTPDKIRLGANAIVATSLAVADAASRACGAPLWRYLAEGDDVRMPLPEIQIIGGGAHAGDRLDIQDFLIMCPNACSFEEALLRTHDVYWAAHEIMASEGRLRGVADEGGWWPELDSNEHAIELILRAIEQSGQRPGEDVFISLDIAASQFYRDGYYVLKADSIRLSSEELTEYFTDLVRRYPILSIEDPFDESDHGSFARLVSAIGANVQIVGDDYLVTDSNRILRAGEQRRINCALIKPNQVGTLSETRLATRTAQDLGLGTIMSARSGESEDVSISHLAVGFDCGQVKVGSFARGERTAKWNELIRIEQRSKFPFAGMGAIRFSK